MSNDCYEEASKPPLSCRPAESPERVSSPTLREGRGPSGPSQAVCLCPIESVVFAPLSHATTTAHLCSRLFLSDLSARAHDSLTAALPLKALASQYAPTTYVVACATRSLLSRPDRAAVVQLPYPGTLPKSSAPPIQGCDCRCSNALLPREQATACRFCEVAPGPRPLLFSSSRCRLCCV